MSDNKFSLICNDGENLKIKKLKLAAVKTTTERGVIMEIHYALELDDETTAPPASETHQAQEASDE